MDIVDQTYGAALFSDMEVEAIRKMRDEDWPLQSIANQFACNKVTVHDICTRKTYRE